MGPCSRQSLVFALCRRSAHGDGRAGAAQGVVDGVKTYTGKDEYHFGDLTEATMKRITGDDNYKFGDLTKGAIKSMTGKDEYKFGDITRSFLKAWKAGSEKPEDKRNEDK